MLSELEKMYLENSTQTYTKSAENLKKKNGENNGDYCIVKEWIEKFDPQLVC